MVELKTVAFLDICLENNQIAFRSDVPEVTPCCRYLDDARYAFCEDGATGLEELYYMHRNVMRPEDKVVMERCGLRYDVTLIPSGLVGKEFNKTVGHYHPLKPGTSYTYPEVYEVLYGEATYLLQRPGANRGEIADVVIVTARAGDKVVIPPGYGHITINAAQEPLVMANWVASEFSSVYEDIRTHRGGAYYALSTQGELEWQQNPSYSKVPALRLEKPIDYPEFGLFAGQPMYKLIFESPEKLRFLTHPEEYTWQSDAKAEVAATGVSYS